MWLILAGAGGLALLLTLGVAVGALAAAAVNATIP